MSKLRVPKYAFYKPRNCAAVIIDGKRYCLGEYGSPESKAEYERIVRQWMAEQNPPDKRDEISTVEAIDAYWVHCKTYFGPESDRKSETYNLKPILRLLRERHGDELASDFDTVKLKALRDVLIGRGNTRPTVNKQIDRIRRMFRWSAGEKLTHQRIYADLMTVQRLRKGRSEAPEGRTIPPVSSETVDATTPFLSDVVADMVQFQQATGARPSEVCIMCPGDIDRTGDVWEYVPRQHKTEHHGKSRTVYVGPRGQAILTKYLLRPDDAACFTPQRKPIGAAYTTGSYRQAIHRACRRAGISLWGPNQLRKARATEIRRTHGVDAAAKTLGHSNVRVTMDHYAEVDRQLALNVARQTG